MADKFQILHVASWFPSQVHASLGNFIQRHIDAISSVHGGEVWAPVPVKGSMSSIQKMRVADGEDHLTSGLPVKRLYHAATRPQLLGVARSVAAETRRMDWKPDLVHVHVAHPAGAAAVAWAQRWGVPVVLTEHWTGYHDAKAIPWWRRRAIMDTLNGVDVVCPVTSNLGESITAWGTPAPICVVPNVVDTNRFQPAEVQTLAGVPVGVARRKLEGGPLNRILHVSSMDDGQKNISGLLEALESITAQDTPVRATLVGGEKAGLDMYQTWVNSRNLAGRIRLTGPLDAEGVVRAMQSHDVLLLNSRSENFPCVIAEAWACGIPVMSTDVGGIREHLPQGPSDRGWLLPAHADIASWTNAFNQVQNTTWDADAIRAYACTHFSVEAVAKAYDSVYRQLLQSQPSCAS